jgi:hypothetical protein
LPVDGVHAPDQQPNCGAVAAAWRGKRLRLSTAKPVSAGLRSCRLVEELDGRGHGCSFQCESSLLSQESRPGCGRTPIVLSRYGPRRRALGGLCAAADGSDPKHRPTAPVHCDQALARQQGTPRQKYWSVGIRPLPPLQAAVTGWPLPVP